MALYVVEVSESLSIDHAASGEATNPSEIVQSAV